MKSDIFVNKQSNIEVLIRTFLNIVSNLYLKFFMQKFILHKIKIETYI